MEVIIMIEKTKKIGNPLTIVGVFAALSEVASVSAIGLVDKTLQPIFIWFIMGFPIILVALFFLTLNFNPKVLYAPSDYKDEKHFLSTIQGFAPIKIEKEKKVIEGTAKKKVVLMENKKFSHEKIELDDKIYKTCEFNHCEIIYRGIGEMNLASCSFNDCVWTLAEPASNGISYLTAIYHGIEDYGKELVEDTFNKIRKGK